MCGRYVVIATYEEIEVRYYVKTKEVKEVWKPNRNIGVGAKGMVITDDKPKEVQLFTFGLTPSWAKKKLYFFNARAEGDGNKEDDPNYSGGKGIISKPSFRNAIRKQRCLIPANGFIEGPKLEKLDKPYYCYLRNEPLFSLAGIWETWVNPDGGEIEHSFAIITTVANELLQKIGHHRMPVILSREHESLWLDKEAPLHDITALLEPYSTKEMNAYPMDKRIKNPRAQDEDLLKPIGELVIPETDFNYTTSLKLVGKGHGKRDNRPDDNKPDWSKQFSKNKEEEK